MKSQLDRILRSDLNQYKVAVTERLENIDHLGSCLTQRTNFINNFQNILKKEIQSMGKQSLKLPCKVEETDSINIDCLKYINKENRHPIDQQIKIKKENLVDITKQKQMKTQEAAQIQVQIYNKLQKEALKSMSVKYCQFLKEIRKSLKFMKAIIKQEISIVHGTVKANIEQYIESLKISIQSKYEQRIRQLQQSNEQLSQRLLEFQKQESRSISRVSTSRFESQFSRIDIQEPVFVSRQPKQDQCLYMPVQDEKLLIVKNQEPYIWNHYKCQVKQPSSLKKIRAKDNAHQLESSQPKMPGLLKKNWHSIGYSLPNFQKIMVSNPSVREGFGTFKMGDQTLYRGGWKNGQFHGQGILTLPEYTYQGQFQKGAFHGCGSLKMDHLSYVGEFLENQACGQGTLKIGGHKIMGRWDKNRLRAKYQ